MYDLETIAYRVEFKTTSNDGYKPSRQPRLTDEFNYDDDYGYAHMERWHDRAFAPYDA